MKSHICTELPRAEHTLPLPMKVKILHTNIPCGNIYRVTHEQAHIPTLEKLSPATLLPPQSPHPTYLTPIRHTSQVHNRTWLHRLITFYNWSVVCGFDLLHSFLLSVTQKIIPTPCDRFLPCVWLGFCKSNDHPVASTVSTVLFWYLCLQWKSSWSCQLPGGRGMR